MAILQLIPAYGRDYKSAKAVKSAWNEGKDFQIADFFHPDNGRYINLPDSRKGDILNIRFNANRDICQIKGGPLPAPKLPKAGKGQSA